MMERGGLDQSLKRDTKPRSVHMSFWVNRSLVRELQDEWMLARTLSSASSKFSRERVRRFGPTDWISSVVTVDEGDSGI